MKNGIVIADAGPVFSLAVAGQLDLLNQFFDEIRVSRAVWNEITLYKDTTFYIEIRNFFNDKITDIKGKNDLNILMDKGESESVILYKELKADFLLIDDKKARKIAEKLNVNCIGTLGVLIVAKEKGFIKELRPIFIVLLQNKRFYSVELLNAILVQNDEIPFKV